MINTADRIRHFGPLKCDRCKKVIDQVAHSLSGDERLYCRKCWPIVKKEAERKCMEAKAEC